MPEARRPNPDEPVATIQCPVCRHQFEVPAEASAELARCPSCGIQVSSVGTGCERYVPPSPEAGPRKLRIFAKVMLILNVIPLLLMGASLLVSIPGPFGVQVIVAAAVAYGMVIGLPSTVLALLLLAFSRRKHRRRWLAGLAVFGCCTVGCAWLSPLLRTRALYEVAADATRLRVRSGGGCHRNREEEETLIDVSGADQVRDIARRIRVKGDFPGPWGACMCCGWPTLEFYRGDRLVAMVSCHHGTKLRWHGGRWPCDATLTAESAAFLKKWLNDNGANEARWRAKRDSGPKEAPRP